MAERRMYTKKVTDSDQFTSLSSSSQALYFHLCQGADDDGFNNQISMAMFKAHASPDDVKVLLAKRFILQFENGVIVIKHWRMHNVLRKDRYTPTAFQEEFAQLKLKENGSYSEADGLPVGCQVVAERLPDGCQVVAAGKVREGKESVGKDTTACAREDDFERWWKVYPKKVGKGEARKAFTKIRVDVETLIKATEVQTYSKQWTIEGGRFIPNPATWLNQCRWEDEVQNERKGGFEQRPASSAGNSIDWFDE